MSGDYWTYPSIVSIAHDHDPVIVVLDRAKSLVLRAMEQGWGGPPFDPIALADILGIPVRPRADVPDARLVPSAAGKVTLEFNPNRPRGRMRFSLAHELAHTLFPDFCNGRNKTVARGGRGNSVAL